VNTEENLISKRESAWTLYFWIKFVLSLGLSLMWWLGTKLSVTDRRVIWKKGLFGMRERSIPLRQVQDVSVQQGILGRMFGYGTVRIESAGGPRTEIVAFNISRPTEIRDAILDQLA
jgi:uncharacterized membrane protein YdbT with pleckstrin-like domain